ncbi:MAG: response regulator transcription factor [Eubacterium sp.]|nr:response regulator transcription factor [Eubacterium sp.]
MRLLVVEDQQNLRDIIARKLAGEGHAVDACEDGRDALDHIRLTEYDGIVLDIMLPGITGLDILREMRSSGNHTPVLLLTALSSVDDRVAGLDAGADDYLVKPFDFDELLARIRAMTRRRGTQVTSIISHKGVELNMTARTVKRDGKEIQLTAKEYSILEYLMQNIGRAMSRDRLSTHVWNYDYDGGSNVIDVYMHHLRKKLDTGHEEKLITTVKGVGYIIK